MLHTVLPADNNAQLTNLAAWQNKLLRATDCRVAPQPSTPRGISDTSAWGLTTKICTREKTQEENILFKGNDGQHRLDAVESFAICSAILSWFFRFFFFMFSSFLLFEANNASISGAPLLRSAFGRGQTLDRKAAAKLHFPSVSNSGCLSCIGNLLGASLARLGAARCSAHLPQHRIPQQQLSRNASQCKFSAPDRGTIYDHLNEFSTSSSYCHY